MKKIALVIVIMILFVGNYLVSQSITVGLINHQAGSLDDGYILFSPNYSKTTYLIDKCGYIVNKWACNYRPGFSAYLLPNGDLVRTGYLANRQFLVGGSGGIIEKFDWDGNLIWTYTLSNDNECLHHDIRPLPNGNILALCWDKLTEPEATAIGRKPTMIDSCVWGEKIIELRPIGKDSAEIIWEWKVWDHIVQNADSSKHNFAEISLHPELVNINYSLSNDFRDWIHCNSIAYNSKFDQILISSHNFGEIWIIDHSTTIAEAAEHKGGKYNKGGDLLYRWGNPIAYGRGKVADQKLFCQHAANWIPEGFPNENCIRVFNNERISDGVRFSSADIFKPPVDSAGFYNNQLPYGPKEPIWTYIADNPQNFYSSILGSVQQLSNGNVLICDGGGGDIFEIDSLKNEVWHYINPVSVSGITIQGQSTMAMNQLFNCQYYPNTYSAFEGKDLSKKGLVENKNSNSESCTPFLAIQDIIMNEELIAFPNPTDEVLTIETLHLGYTIEIFDTQGNKILTAKNIKTVSTKDFVNGLYFIHLINENGEISKNKFVIGR
jgi:hypothetical protein